MIDWNGKLEATGVYTENTYRCEKACYLPDGFTGVIVHDTSSRPTFWLIVADADGNSRYFTVRNVPEPQMRPWTRETCRYPDREVQVREKQLADANAGLRDQARYVNELISERDKATGENEGLRADVHCLLDKVDNASSVVLTLTARAEKAEAGLNDWIEKWQAERKNKEKAEAACAEMQCDVVTAIYMFFTNRPADGLMQLQATRAKDNPGQAILLELEQLRQKVQEMSDARK